MKKLNNFSVGIPAFNEEHGIALVLQDILAQESPKGWQLSEILVYCDGCSDQTVAQAKTVKDRRIRILDGKKRVGKTLRLQQMFQAFQGEILIMIDGDVRIAGRRAFADILAAFADPQVGYVAGNSQAETPKTFVQRAVNLSFEVFDAVRKKDRCGENVYCVGSFLALNRSFARSVRFPRIINEDVYLYLFAKTHQVKFRWVQTAIANYKLPLNFHDYLKQIWRSQPAAFTEELRPYFPAIIDQEAARPKGLYVTEVLKAALRNPAGWLCILCINLLSKPFTKHIITHYSLRLFTAESTH